MKVYHWWNSGYSLLWVGFFLILYNGVYKNALSSGIWMFLLKGDRMFFDNIVQCHRKVTPFCFVKWIHLFAAPFFRESCYCNLRIPGVLKEFMQSSWTAGSPARLCLYSDICLVKMPLSALSKHAGCWRSVSELDLSLLLFLTLGHIYKASFSLVPHCFHGYLPITYTSSSRCFFCQRCTSW